MSIARGVLSGFLKEGLEQKAARDEMYADMVKETGQEFRKTAQLFRKNEEDTEKRFKLIEEKVGTPGALYASYNGLTTSDAGMNLMFNAPKDFLDKLKDFDFQGYDFSTAKSSRFMNFKDQQSDAINLITKNQGSGPVAELFFKDMKSMDKGTEVPRPELDLPKMNKYKFITNIVSSFSKCFDVSSEVFKPKPKIKSAVVKFEFNTINFDINKAYTFSNLIFKNVRKKIYNNINIRNKDEILNKRVNELSIDELLYIYNLF